ncbi:MAG TPA: TonB family protein [Myxococcaceae bacterium]|nr:TonB family protein [Myxococcaceae bacterium]
MSEAAPVTLRLSTPEGGVRDVLLSDEMLVLGSGPAAGLRVHDPSVSSLHLLLKRHRDTVLAIDLASEAGTQVGDAPLHSPRSLRHEEVIRRGRSRLTLYFGAAPAIAPHAGAPAGLPRHEGFVPRGGLQPAPRIHGAAALAMDALPAAPRVLPVRHAAFPRGETSAWKLLLGPLPAALVPSEKHRVLQAALVWGDQMLGVEHLSDKEPLRVGEDDASTFQVFHHGLGRAFELARVDHGQLRVTVPEGAEWTVFDGAHPVAISDIRDQGRLKLGAAGSEVLLPTLREAVRVRFGRLSLLLRWVRPARRTGLLPGGWETLRFTTMLLGSAALLATLIMAIRSAPPVRPHAWDVLGDNQHWISLVRRPPPPPPRPRAGEKKEDAGAEEGKAAPDEPGKVGKQDATQKEAEASKKGSPAVDPRVREANRARAFRGGLLGALKGQAMSDVLGPGSAGTGMNQAIGGLRVGTGPSGTQQGVGGMGARGMGLGGGGEGLGVGGAGTVGLGEGSGGYGRVDLGGRKKDSVRVVPGQTIVVGGLAREVISRVIQEHQSEIKYCYETQLNRNPSLAGKVTVLFTIDGSGTVSDSQVSETTLQNQDTERCMLAKIRRWKFPEPAGGGVVKVNFPWIFKPAGAA